MKRIEAQAAHQALVTGDADDRARQDFAFTLRNMITSWLMPATRQIFERRAGPAFQARNGRAPQSPGDIRSAMDADSLYRFYLSARRTSQDLIWNSVVPAVAAAGQPEPGGSAGGTLALDPEVELPRYASAIDIHSMPGGYAQDTGTQAAGAMYDRGVYLYMSGLLGPMNDAVGRLGVAYLQKTLPDFAPEAILDLGCGVGHSTLPYGESYPEAELHAIDIGPDLLRYAHARAEGAGIPVHFRQANAERTEFKDGAFDLVTSHIVLHETSTRALPSILAECHRLLTPGGYMLHIDQPGFADLDAFSTFLQENETFYNNEPFWRQFRRTDLGAAAEAAGFSREDIRLDILSADVVRQSQNNGPAGNDGGKEAGFLALLARRS